jgi:predicted dithiol-disulfide oxidoreductase (DUF899 family)
MAESCPECGQPCDDMDRLVDHLGDSHDALLWVVRGRPIATGDTR